MQIDRKTKEELNQLSKEVFGSTSKWRKMMELGVPSSARRYYPFDHERWQRRKRNG